MESFFSLLQKNVLNTRRWDSREELRLAMVTWIETKYNRRRRQRALGKLTPVEFEMIYTAADAAWLLQTPSVNQTGGRPGRGVKLQSATSHLTGQFPAAMSVAISRVNYLTRFRPPSVEEKTAR